MRQQPHVIERGSMETRWSNGSWADVRCEVASVQALVQQLAVQLVPRGYWYFVSGTIPADRDPEHVDRTIIERYQLFEDPSGRRAAELKRHGVARVKYLRYRRFYVIIATKGTHFFKLRERDRIRCLKKDRRAGEHSKMGRVMHIDQAFPFAPLLIPLDTPLRVPAKRKKNKHKKRPANAPSVAVFEGYSISYRQGRYQRKTPDERAEYQRQIAVWKRKRKQVVRLPKPAKGKRDDKWRTHTEIEQRSLKRLEAYFLEHATDWKREKLAIEFHSTPYQPYWAVKQQLFGVLRKVNKLRRTQGLSELPYKTVFGMKRAQIPVFVEREDAEDHSEAA